MPMPYTHLAIALTCKERLAVDDINDFCLVALMPDIRYFTGKPRSQYHSPIERLNELTSGVEVSDSFVLGYGIHLITDELWGTDELRDQYKQYFPFFVRKKLNIKILEAALEIHCLKQHPVAIKLKPQGNELTRALEISETTELLTAAQALQTYIDERKLQTGLQIAEASGKYTPERLAQMKKFANALDRNPFTRALVYALVTPPSRRIYKQLIDSVLARIPKISLQGWDQHLRGQRQSTTARPLE